MGIKVEYLEIDSVRADITACRKAADLYEAGARVYLWAGSQAEAVLLDALLWTFDDNSFVPHGLWSGEGSIDDPVAVGWLGQKNPNNAGALVIASDHADGELTATAGLFGQVCDFVPTMEGAAKRAARRRYKAFVSAGFNPVFTPLGE